ncbi:hypothetical protein EON64_20910, partial [archaeon]
MHLSRIDRFTALHRPFLPLAPITGYSWAERRGEVQHLSKHQDPASGQLVDLVVSLPLPSPKALYLPREYHVSQPKTFPLPRAGSSTPLVRDAQATLPSNTHIPDASLAAWVERIASSTVREVGMCMFMCMVMCMSMHMC